MKLQEELKALKERIAELEEQVKEEQEFPQGGDWYWYIASDVGIGMSSWGEFEFEKDMLAMGNIFKTKDQAEFVVEKLKVEAELRKFSRPFKCGGFNHYIFIDTDSNRTGVENRAYCPPQGTIYFESEEKAHDAIQSVGEDRIKKYIFGVEG